MDEQYAPVEIVLDSGDLTAGTRDYPSFTLSPALEDVVGVTIHYANVPFTYDVVDYFNNVCQIVVDIGGTNTEQAFNLSIGTYTSQNILRELTNRLADSGLSGASNYKFFIESDSNRLVIYNAVDNFQWRTTSDRTSAEVLGFEKNKTYSATFGPIINENDIFTGNVYSIRSPFSVNLSGSAQMYLHCPQLQGHLKGAVRAGPNMSDVAGFWPIKTIFLNFIVHEAPFPAVFPFSDTTITNLDFYLTIGSKKLYGNSLSTATKYLSLKGLPFQVGIRFYRRNKEFVQAYVNNAGDRSQRITSTGNQGRYM